MRLGRFDDALATIDRGLAFVDGLCQLHHVTDLRRLRAEVLHNLGAPSADVEAEFQTAYELCRRDHLLLVPGQVRWAAAYARWLAAHGRHADAINILSLEVVDAFSEQLADGREVRAARETIIASS